MKVRYILVCSALLLAFSACTTEDTTPIEGVWELISHEFEMDGKITPMELSDEVRMVKSFSQSHFTFMNHKPDPSCFNTYGGYGTYTYTDSTFTENIIPARDPTYEFR